MTWYSDPVYPQFFQGDLPATRLDGSPIDWSGSVTMTITVRRADRTEIVWSTESDPPTLVIEQDAGAWRARHDYTPAPSELPFVGPDRTMRAHFDFDATVDGAPVQIPSLCRDLTNFRACRP